MSFELEQFRTCECWTCSMLSLWMSNSIKLWLINMELDQSCDWVSMLINLGPLSVEVNQLKSWVRKTHREIHSGKHKLQFFSLGNVFICSIMDRIIIWRLPNEFRLPKITCRTNAGLVHAYVYPNRRLGGMCLRIPLMCFSQITLTTEAYCRSLLSYACAESYVLGTLPTAMWLIALGWWTLRYCHRVLSSVQ